MSCHHYVALTSEQDSALDRIRSGKLSESQELTELVSVENMESQWNKIYIFDLKNFPNSSIEGDIKFRLAFIVLIKKG